jgi:DNA-binding MarR family transcriptional regulator
MDPMTEQMAASMELTRLSKQIVEFYERLSSWEESVVRDSGLTTAQAHTIEMVGHSGAIKMKDLAEKIGITTGTLSVAVDRLEKKHLLRRTPHQTDRRAFLIELTPEGEACFREHHEFHLKMTRKIVSGLTASEQKTFVDVIEKILKKI